MKFLLSISAAMLVACANADTTVNSYAELISAINNSVQNELQVKLASNVDFDPYTQEPAVVPTEQNLTLDLNGKKLTGPLVVGGKLKVVDTSDEKCGFINGQVDAQHEQIEFDLHNVATVCTSAEFNNVASLNSLGADINMKLGCVFGKDAQFLYPPMVVPSGADITVDMNKLGFTYGSITVQDQGKLTIANNLFGNFDYFLGGISVEPGGSIVYKGIRDVEAPGSPFLPGYQANPFDQIINLQLAGAEITARLLANIDTTFVLSPGTPLTIDLYGHTLSGQISVEGGNLMVVDRLGGGEMRATVAVDKSGKYECTVPKKVLNASELSAALAAGAGSTVYLQMAADMSCDTVEIPTGAEVMLDLSGKMLICDKMKVLGGLTLVDSAGKSGYIMADETYIGRKGFVKIAYGPLRTTLTYLSQGLMLMFK